MPTERWQTPKTTENTGTKIFFPFPVKIQGDSYGSGVGESEYDNQIALSPTIFKGQGIKV